MSVSGELTVYGFHELKGYTNFTSYNVFLELVRDYHSLRGHPVFAALVFGEQKRQTEIGLLT